MQQFCHFVFNGSNIEYLKLIGLVDSFYKRNILTFSNHTFENFTSVVKILELIKVENINVDFNLLNPQVLMNTTSIYIFGPINRIDGEIFNKLKGLNFISFNTRYFRKTMHKNGIEWIRAIKEL